MLYTRQYFIADRVKVVTFFLIKIFGLWPYKVNLSTHQIELDLLAIIYSIIMSSLMMFAYVYIGSALFDENLHGELRAQVFASLPLQMIVTCYSYLVIVSYLIMYVGQHFLYKKKKSVYLMCEKLADCMREYRTESVNFNGFLMKFFCKSLVYDVVCFALFLYNLSSSSVTVNSHPYLSIFVYLPIYTIRLNTNVFYGGILFFNVVYKQLNQNLNKIFDRHGRTHIRPTELSELSSQFEKASMLYIELFKATKAFNSLFAFQLTIWITTQLLTMITQVFYQYVALVRVVAFKESFFVNQNIAIVMAMLLTSYEVYTTAFACNSLMREVVFLTDSFM